MRQSSDVVNIYCDSVGPRKINSPDSKRVSGPYMVAYYLFRALCSHADFQFTFFTQYESELRHPQVMRFSSFKDGAITHILGNQRVAVQAQLIAERLPLLILGPNVLFNSADGDLEEASAANEAQQLEARVAGGPFDLLLFPSFWNGCGESLNRRLRARALAAFPVGVELPNPVLFGVEPSADFLILAKGSYSNPVIREPSESLSTALLAKLAKDFRVTLLQDYEVTELQAEVARHKLVIFTGPFETQGLARLEASGVRATIVSASLPYRAPELGELRTEFAVEAFAATAIKLLPRWRELAKLSRCWIERDFSLRRLYDDYCRLLFPRGRGLVYGSCP